MINAKLAEEFFSRSKCDTIEEAIDHKIVSEALAGCRAILFQKKDFGRTEKAQNKVIEELKKNGFSISGSSFNEDDIYVEF